MVVMAVIGVLAAISINSFQSSQTKARDAQRKSDLEQIQRALEAYHNDYEEYPEADANHRLLGCNGSAEAEPVACDWGEEWSDANDTIYMIELPADPRDNLHYYYESDGESYQLYARLENTQDSSIPTVEGESAHYNLLCGDSNCNYGLASTNTTPESGQTISADWAFLITRLDH